MAPDGPSPERGDYSEVVLEKRRLRDALVTAEPRPPLETALDDAYRKLTRPEGAYAGGPQPRLPSHAHGQRRGPWSSGTWEAACGANQVQGHRR